MDKGQDISANQNDYEDLRKAVDCLQTESLTVLISSAIGSLILKPGAKALPKWAKAKLTQIAHKALISALAGATFTMRDGPGTAASTKVHKALTGVSGAAFGVFGLPGALLEVPVTTTLTLRAIADVARSEGFDVLSPAVRIECASVLALGANTPNDDDAFEGYFAARSSLAHVAKKAAEELAAEATKRAAGEATKLAKGITTDKAGSWIAQYVAQILEIFRISLTSKTAALIIPVLGAASAATLNILFTNYYQTIARGHFIVMRLEDKYGRDVVKNAMNVLEQERKRARPTGK